MPTIAIVNPTPGSTVSGMVTITGTAADNVALAKVEVAIDSGSYGVVFGTGTWSYSWDTRPLPNGSHTLAARATDSTGNTASVSLSVTVANSGGTPPPADGGCYLSTPASAADTDTHCADGTAPRPPSTGPVCLRQAARSDRTPESWRTDRRTRGTSDHSTRNG